MHMKSVLASALFVAAAVADISFTSFPQDVEVGKPVTITWASDSDDPVTITLRKGPSDNLKDVETLTTSGKDGSFTWTPTSSLQNGKDYALQISQGDDFNYGTQFSIAGGSGKGSPVMPNPSETGKGAPVMPSGSATESGATTQTLSLSSGASSATASASITSGAPTASPSAGPSNSRNSTSPTTLTKDVTSTPSGPTSAPSTPEPTTGAAAPIAAMSSPFALIMGVLAAFAYLN
ncbi:hypothetical protein AJ79_04081 [Helicocarpus griseus UAMH5409]|uniref:Yeast cell wall synthesis Kre9/Knh1-like N-terminal domain-containing protein n=1 Tax=Helicocarpus griseus UAMH5409 TaxID=1447875 RepID=A0A2B7XVC2_9EURO|nr:hypothetical protein AJ79_04081 [Helicocarpus griseus UAMH5409]